MSSFSVVSLNVKGIRDSEKRRKIFLWILKHGADRSVLFIQEAHCTPEIVTSWSKEWKAPSFYCCGTNQSRGVIILICQYVEFKLLKIKKDKEGRMIMTSCMVQGQKYVLVNTCAPNTEKRAVTFL